MSAESALLRFGIGVATEPWFLLQMHNEHPDFTGAYVNGICRQSLARQEFLQVFHRAPYHSYRLRALGFRLGAEAVATDKTGEFGS